MLLVMAWLLPILQISTTTTAVYEITAHLGAWCNVLPWAYGGVTGAVMKKESPAQRGGNWQFEPPADNDKHVAVIVAMLATCALTDIVAWAIVLVALTRRALGGSGGSGVKKGRNASKRE